MENITGKKVKINYDKLFNERMNSKRYAKFLKKNKDTVFTAILDIDNKYTQMYILKEDESNPKWLFHVEDLIIVEE